ncbi:hypothetical protein AAKU67_004232 [Oxalobacteraceae bacterium GrIS 2.11]
MANYSESDFEGKFNSADYPQTYTASTGNKVAAAITGSLLGIILPIIILISLNSTNPRNGNPIPLILIFSMVPVIFVPLVLSTFKFKITLHPDRIEYQGLIKKWTIQRRQIGSWRMPRVQNGAVLEITSSNVGNQVMKCTMQCKPDAQFNAWFAGLTNPDLLQLKQLEQQISENPDYGDTPEERLLAAKRTKKSVFVLNVLAAVILYWSMIYPYPNMLPIWICLAMPWFAILVCWQSRGLISLISVERKYSTSNLTSLLMAPALGLLLRALTVSNLLDWSDGIFWSLIFSLPLLFFIGVATQWFSKTLKLFLAALVIAALYGYGAVVASNQLLDHAQPGEQSLTILGRHETHGKGAAGYFTVPSWGKYSGENDVRVGWNMYYSHAVGELICMQIHPGIFHIRWFSVVECPQSVPRQSIVYNSVATPYVAVTVKKAGSENATVDFGTPHSWGLAVGMILGAQSRMHPDMLGGWATTTTNAELVKPGLERWWGIHNRDELLSEIRHLERFGHRAEFERLGQMNEALNNSEYKKALSLFAFNDLFNIERNTFVKQHYVQLKQKSLLAFDLVRVVNLSRQGYLANYISEEEAWSHIMMAADRLQRTYNSWHDLSDNYLLGRQFWGGNKEGQAEFATTLQCVHDLQNGPWQLNSWEMPLH